METRTGSSTDLNSTVPTAAEGSIGVKQKWLVGETMTTSKSSVSMILDRACEPQPEPRTKTTGFSALRRVRGEEGDGGEEGEEEVDDALFDFDAALTLGVVGENVRRAMTARSASVSLALSTATSSEGRAAGHSAASRAKTSSSRGGGVGGGAGLGCC